VLAIKVYSFPDYNDLKPKPKSLYRTLLYQFEKLDFSENFSHRHLLNGVFQRLVFSKPVV
jgi:hypothetical protein